MFNLGGIGLKLAIGALIVSIMTGGFFYVQKLRSDIKFAHELNARLEDNIRAKDAALGQLRRDIENMNRIQNDLNVKLRAAQATANDLAKRFNVDRNGNERNFGKLANENPSLIEGKINHGTKDALRCNELATGSPLTDDEKSGKIKNSICPELLPMGEKK